MKKRILEYSPIILIIILVLFHRLATIPNTRSLPSDSGNIASFVEGLNSSENIFEKDEILYDKKMYNWYTPAYIFLIKSLSGLFGGNYYLAFWSQIDILMFLFLMGCYLFGRDFIGGTRYGILFMLMNLIFIKIPMLGGWAIPHTAPRPTVLFISLLPLVLWGVWKYRGSKRGRYFMIFILGLTFYIHPVSAPYWILSIWFSLWFLNDTDIKLKEKVISQVKYLLILLFTMLPYIIIYTNRYIDMDDGNLSFQKLMEIFHFRINRSYFKLFGFPLAIWENFPIFLQILTILSIIIILFFVLKKKKEIKHLILFIWFISLIIVGSVLPFLDQKITSLFKRFPYEIDLARNYIFLPFLVYIIFFLFIKKLEEGIKDKKILYNIVSNLVIIFIAILMITIYIPKTIIPVVNNWIEGKFYEKPKQNYSDVGTKLIKENTSIGDAIFHFPGRWACLYVRYQAKRSLVYSFKDGCVFLYSGNNKKLVSWYHRAQETGRLIEVLGRVKSKDVPEKICNRMVLLAKKNKADYLLISEKYRYKFFHFKELQTFKYKGQVLVNLVKKD